jgi:glycerophosphoryl diester phosphodiesterase
MTHAPDWLVARPIAHRGLHDARAGVIENSVSAARAAIASGFGVECDVQLTRDGDLVVFHDDTLERLTAQTGDVAHFDARALAALGLTGGQDKIPTLAAFLSEIAGRTPLVVELKSRFDGDLRGAQRAAALLADYAGPVVIESFDPEPMAFLRAHAQTLGIAQVPLGMVGEARYSEEDWPMLSPAQRVEMTHFLHYPHSRPDFLSWSLADLPHAIPFLLRTTPGLPVTTWTVRSPEQAALAAQWTDQIVFEGFRP